MSYETRQILRNKTKQILDKGGFMKTLTEKQRTIFRIIIHYLSKNNMDVSAKTIAEELDIDEATVSLYLTELKKILSNSGRN